MIRRIIKGELLTREEANSLIDAPLEELCKAADEIRRHFCGTKFDVCSIFNGKCGKCSENCKFCAQSVFHKTEISEYSMIENAEKIVQEANYNHSKGIQRFAIVTSGRGLSDKEAAIVCANYKAVADSCAIGLCASHGLLTARQLENLKESGVTRIHCNLETGRNYFPNICTTHTYDDRVNTIKAAQKIGLEICSGGIFGLGESWADRIDMAFDLRELGVKSVPINALQAIPGTPLEGQKPLLPAEIRRIVAIYRFILPDAAIRMAAGRGLLSDKGRSLFQSGANACITGDMLTTAGVHVDEDMPMIQELGFVVTPL